MKLLFQKARYGGIVGRLVGLWTRGPYCHVEIIFDDSSVMFSSTPLDSGVRFIDIGTAHDYEYDIFQLPSISYNDLQTVTEWAMLQRGKPYDWWGVFGFIVPFLHDDDGDWFCSEICAEALVRVGLLPELTTSKISPNDLAKLVTRRYKKISGH